MPLGHRELNLGLGAAGLSDLASSWLRSQNVQTIGEFVDVSEEQLRQWRICRAMRTEIVARQEAAKRGDLILGNRRQGHGGGTLGALSECAAQAIAGAFKLAVAFIVLAATVIALRLLVRFIL